MFSAAVAIDRHAVVGPVRRRLFGSFVEHLGRCVYDGIYEPEHPTADADGFRSDVVELVRELGVSTIRYPGGNFVSGYRWEDGVGPRDERPVRRDLAWHSTETNQVGLDEFARWAKLTGTEVMLAVNLGTRGIAEALDLLEYTNGHAGTTLADQRIANGSPDPHAVRMWCLGNEMDGPWQIGHLTAEDYGTLAARTAAAMRMADPALELVVCGSSDASMPTFGTWERTVLERTYDYVDYISCHAYYEPNDGDLVSFLASSVGLEQFIRTVVAAADHVKSTKRGTKDIMLSFDEWNVWYHEPQLAEEAQLIAADRDGTREWPIAPRLLEDVYSVMDAVVVGSLLITLLKNADRVTSASLAQLVNVIAPIMTEPGGPSWRQTTFYPFALTSRLAAGVVLRPHIDVATVSSTQHGEAPLVDVAVTWDEQTQQLAVFAVNRSLADSARIRIDLNGLPVIRVTETAQISDRDIHAKNTLAEPNRIVARPIDGATLADGIVSFDLPAVAWGVVGLGS
jgi:alpha-N-arabinofuranosidase